jgi:SHS2 domain-containing protein
MGRVVTFDHTADLGLRIYGADPEDLFRTAAEGLFDVIVANRDLVGQGDEIRLSLTADSPETLLVAWLNELIFRSETEHQLFSRFDLTLDLAKCRLDAVFRGETIDPSRHLLDHEVKAVTHHATSLNRNQDGWVAEVILDI